MFEFQFKIWEWDYQIAADELLPLRRKPLR